MTAAVPLLSYEQTAQVLKKFANLEHPIVLVGGQAVNFWANYYEDKAPQLAEHAPYEQGYRLRRIPRRGSRMREASDRLPG